MVGRQMCINDEVNEFQKVNQTGCVPADTS